jgi:hypothetical protein
MSNPAKTEAIASQIGNAGKDIKTSMNRCIKVSTPPPKYPDTPPKRIPMGKAKRIYKGPMIRETLPPNIVRENKQRPNLSVPNKKI